MSIVEEFRRAKFHMDGLKIESRELPYVRLLYSFICYYIKIDPIPAYVTDQVVICHLDREERTVVQVRHRKTVAPSLVGGEMSSLTRVCRVPTASGTLP
jgi:hypothetical protein